MIINKRKQRRLGLGATAALLQQGGHEMNNNNNNEKKGVGGKHQESEVLIV